MNPIITTTALSRRFGRTEAVNDLSLTVPEGCIYAFLGPNGAGKTTTIKMLANILRPSGGTASVMGVDSRRLGPAQWRQIGYVSENQRLPEWMRVGEFLRYCRGLYPAWDDAFCQRLVEQFALPPDRKLGQLSRGMKMKATLVSSLAYHPRLLILDEPFTGLDPLVRDEVIRGMLELSEEGGWTAFISSHDIDEVERLADWIGVLHLGSMKIEESAADLQKRFRLMECVLPEGVTRLPAALPETWLVPEVAGHVARWVESRHGGGGDGSTEAQLQVLLPGATQLRAAPMSLREIFLALARTYRMAH